MTKMPALIGDQFVQIIDRFKELDPIKLQQVIDSFTGMQDRQAKAEFNDTMAEVLAEIPAVIKDKTNPLFRSKYASHEAIMDALQPVLKKHGIGVRFGSESAGKLGVARPFLVIFKGLYSETHAIDIGVNAEGPKGGRPAMNEAQALGSGMTYARKYLLMNAFNLVLSEDDDDGNASNRRPRSGLMDQNVRQAVDEAGEHTSSNGNGNGKPTIAEWFDSFQAECEAADSVDEAEAILKRPEVINCQEAFKKYPKTLASIEQVKKAMMKRIYQGDTGSEAATIGEILDDANHTP